MSDNMKSTEPLHKDLQDALEALGPWTKTHELRWVEIDERKDGDNYPISVLAVQHYDAPQYYYALQQAWRNTSNGKLKWEFITIEHNPEKDPSDG